MELSVLEREAKLVVYAARRRGQLNTLTPRLVRQELETKFSLESGTLDTAEYKKPLKSAIATAATEEMPEATPDDSARKPKSEAKKQKRKASGETPDTDQSKPKKKRKSEEGNQDDEADSRPKKKPASKSQKSNKGFKSADTVQSSDFEDAMEGTSMELEQKPAMISSHGSSKENHRKSSTKLKKPPSAKDSASPSREGSPPEAAGKSDTELSELEDEPPKKSRKSKAAKSKDKGTEKSKTSKAKKGPELSKDEETIKRLKSLVLACGVRKQWAKVFKDVDKPSQQIKIIKETLAELGMTGRMSLEQAKSIKEKRELAQELEDVQSFAAAATRAKKPAKLSEEDRKKEESESEAEDLPAKRKRNAHQSIMAFLEDQSDDD